MNGTGRMQAWGLSIALLFIFLNSAFGQQEQGAVNSANTAGNATNGPAQSGMDSPAMDRMAESMTSMADMCRMMMEKEMKNAPLKLGALVTVGALLAVALVLFIVLEVQWIRFWNLRIKTERLKLAQKELP